MKKFPFLRRPLRLILYSLLLALVTTAALIFAWQYKLDGIILDHAIDTFAYVGTVVRSDGQIMDSNKDRDFSEIHGEVPEVGGPAFLEEIPEGLVQWLYDSDLVSRVDNRRTLAAHVGEYTRVHREEKGQINTVEDSMMKVNFVQSYHFLEGRVIQSDCWSDPADEYKWDEYRIKVDRMWSDPSYVHDIMLVDYTRHSSEPQLQVGQKVFLIGAYIYSGDSGQISATTSHISSPMDLKDMLGEDHELSLPQQHGVTIIPEGVDSKEYIQSLLESTGLDEILENQLQGKFSVTLRQTKDMKMIPMFAKGKAKTYEGRVLNPSDMGKKVCVISSALSQRNRLSVGDTITLSVADGCYTIPQDYWNAGWESGNPNDEEDALAYGAYEEYEIVGIYSQRGRKENNALYFTNGDIFIPAQEDTSAQTPRPYAFSFRIPGPDYQLFLENFQPVLDEYGYSLMVEDTGWDDVKESFYTMQSRRQLMLLCAATAFAAAVTVFALLLNAHCRYEYGLRRLMGATRREATGIYCSVFLFTGIPSAAAAVAAARFAAVKLIGKAVENDALVSLPTETQCILTLAIWAAAELAVIALVLWVLSVRSERRGLLKLIRR